MWEIGGTKFYEKDIDLLLSIHQKPTGISCVYLEPFMEIEKYYSVINKFSDAQIHQHLYTDIKHGDRFNVSQNKKPVPVFLRDEYGQYTFFREKRVDLRPNEFRL